MLLRKIQETLEILIKYEKEISKISAERMFYLDTFKNKYNNSDMVDAIDAKIKYLEIKIKKLREELFE